MDPFELNKQIFVCGGIERLARLVRTQVQHFSYVNVATAIKMAAKLQGSDPSAARQPVEDVLGVAAVQHLEAMQPRELANMLHSLA